MSMVQQKDNKMNVKSVEEEITAIKKHVLGFSQAEDSKAWLAVGVSLLFELLAIVLLRLEYQFAGCFLRGFVLIRMFTQLHDMAHFSFFENIQMNRIIGKLYGIYTHYPFNTWRDGHNHHHKHFGNLDRLDFSQTIVFTKQQYEHMTGLKRIFVRIFREPIVFFLITVPFIWFYGLVVLVVNRYGLFSWSFFEKAVSFLSVLFLFPIIGVSVTNSCVSLWFATVIGGVLFHLQHSVNMPYRVRKQKWNFIKAGLQGSTYLQVPLLLKPFTNGIEYHHIHHLNTNVASYKIKQCHDSFEGIDQQLSNWDQFNIHRVHLQLAINSMSNVMLDQDNGILLPFSYSLS